MKTQGNQIVLLQGGAGQMAEVTSSGALLITGNITTTPSTVASVAATEYDEQATASTWVGALTFFIDSSNRTRAIRPTTPLPTDPSDKALRDLGKVDVANLDQYAPVDMATDGSTHSALPVTLLFPAAGAGVSAPGDANGLFVQSTRVSLAPSTHVIGKLAANAGVEIGNVTIAGNCTVVSTSISLAPSTHAIGKLASNTGVTIGTVDVATFTHGLAMKSAAGVCSSAADNTLIAPGAGKTVVVTGYSLTTDQALTGLTASFLSGRGGSELWRVRLQHPSSGMAGANLAVAAPGELFRCQSTAALSLSLSTGAAVHYGVAYWEA